VAAWVVFGEHDEIGITRDERSVLEACPQVSMVTIPDAGHFALNQKPGMVADVVLGAIASKTR
jgi:pimeloyl-ACP methyl ester carboxylesterase